MDVVKILADLRQEKDQLDEAILSLERLAMGRGPRRGRPPAWMADVKKVSGVKKRGRPPGSKNKVKSPPREAQDEAQVMTAGAVA